MTTGSGGLDAGGPAEAGAVISAITTAVTPQISSQLGHVGSIGAAILLVVVAIVAFAWVRRVLTGDSGKKSGGKSVDSTAAAVRTDPVYDGNSDLIGRDHNGDWRFDEYEKYGPTEFDKHGEVVRDWYDEEPMTASGHPE